MATKNADEKNEILKEEETMSMEDIYEKTFINVRQGQIVKGRIVDVRPKEVVIDIGYKSEGLIPIEEFGNAEAPQVGQNVEVYLERIEDEDGMVVLSKAKAEKMQGWERIVALNKEGDILKGKVARKVKGGFMVNVGVEAFLPASLSGARGPADSAQLLNVELEFKIVKINKPRKNIVVSRRDALQQRREEGKHKLLTGLEKGQIAEGVVKNITDFGAFIDLGGLDGLLHITDMSWGRISHPSEVLAIGDKIEVMILGVDRDSVKVSLGLKQKTPNPWLDIDIKYPIGTKVKGKVVNLMPYGAFVELEKGIEGLVHISELSWSKRYNHPNELLAIGDVIEIIVLSVDKENQKIALGLKQLEADPWDKADELFKAGDKIKGKVRNLTDYGAFVELREGIDGLIHVSDMSWTKRIGHPRDMLKKGQKIEAIILSIDKDARKISLGLKQITPDPWEKISETYSSGSIVEGKITNITNFGIFVELENDLEGLVHISEVDVPPEKKIEEVYNPGDTVQVRVLKVEASHRRIALSLKEVK
ncbi:30S ribosomal protein S1 [Omnitrophica bacterium]|nr:30S ribosomal protein S1 [Candidatus Omnitrophota bacterium]